MNYKRGRRPEEKGLAKIGKERYTREGKNTQRRTEGLS